MKSNFRFYSDIFNPLNKYEVPGITELFGLKWKGKADIITPDILIDIKTTSKYIRILCRDHEYEDGDRIKLMLNKAIIHPNITLRNAAYIIDVELKEGLNTIEFYALNEGSSSPNTAQLRVYNEDDSLIGSGEWLLTTGYKASLIVLRE